jgi:hypothetical protein
MEMILDVTATERGRMSGTVTPLAGRDAIPFSGTLELVARIEELLLGPTEASSSDANSQGA